MISIDLNGKKLTLLAKEVRALQIIVAHNFCAPADVFEEGPRKWRKYILPHGDRAVELGVNVASPAASKRKDKFFKKHPRRSVCVTGDPRRINAILKKVDVINDNYELARKKTRRDLHELLSLLSAK